MSEQIGKYKGLLGPMAESQGAELVDFAIKSKNPIIEVVDGPISRAIITGGDNFLGDRIPEEYEDPANELVDALHKAVIGGDKEQFKVVKQKALFILKNSVPLEKVITQVGEDAVIEVLGLVIDWLIDGNKKPEE